MTAPSVGRHDDRVLLLAPRGRDASVMTQVLAGDGLASVACASLGDVVERLREGAGLAFVTEEALHGDELHALDAWLSEQPPWSDFPLVILATRRAGRRSPAALARLENLGNVVLLERPLNSETLVRAARSALRARIRQYEKRHHLEERERSNRENERLYAAERAALREAAEAREALALALDAAELGTFHCPMPLDEMVWNGTGKLHCWLPADARVDVERFYSIVHADDRAGVRAAVASALGARAPYDIEYRTVAADGQCRWLRAKGRAHIDGAGRPVRFDGITIDISRQKELEAERQTLLDAEQAAREQAESSSRMKDEFLATLSHELRTPLSAVLGWVHLLKKRVPSPADLARGVEVIERNARAQAQLIEELLDMSRIIAGNVRLEQQPLLPAPVFDAAIASLQPGADAKAIRIERALDAAAGPVAADAHRLQQVLFNLLSNAIKFTPAGGCIRIGLRRDGAEVVLDVRDDGEGISADFLPFVFERFRQADGSSTRSHGGLGLGLAIVQHLVRLHGGSVEAASAGLGHGTTFTVRLPICAAEPVAADAPAGQRRRNARATSPAALAGLRIVVVDDEGDGRDTIARILSDEGASVVTADSADAATEALQRAPADVLISDIGMPQVNGYELLQRLRTLGHRLPAIALTAFARNDDRHRALAAGYSLHLAKPVVAENLIAAVAQLGPRPAG